MTVETGKILRKSDLSHIKNWGERVFAEACLGISHLIVEYQVRVNGSKDNRKCNGRYSLIDFRVTNLKSGRSRLVEVTTTPKKSLLNSRHKARQIGNLKSCGEPFSVLTAENLNSIVRNKR